MMPRHADKGQPKSTELRAFELKTWSLESDPKELLDQVNQLPGVQRAEFNPKAKRLILLGSFDVAELKVLLEQLGIQLAEEEEDQEERALPKRRSWSMPDLTGKLAGSSEWLRTLIWLIPSSFVVGVLLSLIATTKGPPSIGLLVGTGVLLLGVGLVLGGMRLFKRLPRISGSGRTDTVLLISILLIARTLMGEWAEAALILLLYSAVYWIPLITRRRFEELWTRPFGLLPESVRAVAEKGSGGETGDEYTWMAVETVEPGTLFLVQEGERVGLDGRVLDGSEAVIDASDVTGDPLPYMPVPESLVPAGAKVESGELLLRAERPYEQTLLFSLRPKELLEESEVEVLQSPLVHFLQRLPQIVIYLATAVMLLPPLFMGEAIQPWLNRGLALLLLAPINTLLFSLIAPLLAARVRLAEFGVAPAPGQYLTSLGRVTRLALLPSFLIDSRQTLTAILPCSSISEEDALRLASSLMSNVRHPFGAAFAEAAAGEGLELLTPLQLSTFEGGGIQGTVRQGAESWQLAVGTTLWMQHHGVQLPEEVDPVAPGVPPEGRSILWLAYEDRALAAFVMQSRMRDGSRRFVQRLRKTGVKKIDLLTWQEPSAVEGFVREAGLDAAHTRLSSEAMEEIVASWHEAGETCVVAGQPLDGPLPAGSHVSLAFACNEVDTPPEGQIPVTARDPGELYPILLVARRAFRTSRWAPLVAIMVKAGLLVVALSASPSLAQMAVIEAVGTFLVLLLIRAQWRKL